MATMLEPRALVRSAGMLSLCSRPHSIWSCFSPRPQASFCLWLLIACFVLLWAWAAGTGAPLTLQRSSCL